MEKDNLLKARVPIQQHNVHTAQTVAPLYFPIKVLSAFFFLCSTTEKPNKGVVS